MGVEVEADRFDDRRCCCCWGGTPISPFGELLALMFSVGRQAMKRYMRFAVALAALTLAVGSMLSGGSWY